MTSILLMIQIGLVVVLTIAVLLQKSSSIGLGAYSGSNESVFGAKGPGSFLAKATFFLGFLFVVNTVTLGYFYAQDKRSSIVDTLVDDSNVVAPAVKTSSPTPPSIPADVAKKVAADKPLPPSPEASVPTPTAPPATK